MSTTVVVLVGLPASGKSTAVKALVDQYGEQVHVYSTDALIEQWAASQGWSYDLAFDKYIKSATTTANNELSEAIRHKKTILWDQTNMSVKKRQSILGRFPRTWTKNCICWVPPRDDAEKAELARRLQDRAGKTIPEHVMNSMLKSYEQPTAAEGFARIDLLDIWGNFIE